MADSLPRMNAHSRISKILDKIKSAKTPERFTQDYLSTVLKFPGGSPKAFIALAKRLEFLALDGTPTDLYKRFRNEAESGAAMADALRKGFAPLYERNEYAHELDKLKLEGLVMEISGLDKKSSSLNAICGTFHALKDYAIFDAEGAPGVMTEVRDIEEDGSNDKNDIDDVRLNLAYTINLVLPKTDDIAIFNAIFKALKSNLLG